jgi:large conductance mechanosensitive channel
MATNQESSTNKPTKARVAQSAAAKAAASARKSTLKHAATVRNVKTKEAEGFLNFIKEFSVVGVAIGLVLGTQIKLLVDQLLASFVNPILGIVLPGSGDLSQKIFILHAGDKTAEFKWGQFVFVLLSFILVALIIYYIVKILKLDKLKKED